ncbi:methylated-DNA-[protein]-cysteine S-methyltransferase [Rhodoferax sp. OV413]|uniref:methylated-DNA--[protein]-cysteine S-methyltransferase n=1 Tax=Rhodoferax sp. OV413 TaxID=1855285 RepID=UPI00088A485B|nr:methylated-DNA--[protein]-cysteine S-methyltransferase [Rhodoferax sp. OV413]SDP78599.1 methylated-DNA-[protein]-cysteine S-methyltransferase [Rhodoferax sp. OV413]
MKFSDTAVQTRFDTPLGSMLAAATDVGLCGLWFDAQKHLPDIAHWPTEPTHPVLRQTEAAMLAYFGGDMADFQVPLDLRGGTAFQQAVWQALLRIPSGATTTYGALSHGLGRPSAVRAVAGAVGRNPVSVIVPCHRVLGSDGSLTGYAGGLERKTALLQREATRQALLL